MDAYSIITIFSSAYEYTQSQNIAEKDDNDRSVNVVSLKMLENHLLNDEKEKYQVMIKKYRSLANFLTHKKTNYLNKKWNCGITNRSKYKNYCCSFELKSARLKRTANFDEDLFVIHRFKKKPDDSRRKNSNEELCQEIFDCSQRHFLNEDEYRRREEIKSTYNYAVQLNFFDIEVSVELIGASKYRLDFIHEDLKLAIHIKDSFGYYANLGNTKQNLYDAEFLSSCLSGMGVRNSNIDRLNSGCSFIGLYGISCHARIVSKDIIFERDELILEYLKLDKRVKPLVCAILYFFKCRKLNSFRHPRLLDPSASIVMVLEFLSKGLESPLIPNLRNLDIDCKSSDCLYNTHKKNQVYISYHTCLHIENNRVGKKYSNLEYNGIKPNIWYSNNGDNLGTLLKKFLKYYSQRDSFFNFLEPSEDHTVNYIPYISYKGIKSYRAQYLWEEVSLVFSKASGSLLAGRCFQYVCSE